MKKLVFLLAVLFLPLLASAKGRQVIRPGQYVFEEGTLHMRTAPLVRYEYPLAPAVHPLANLGPAATCYITAITTNAAGKWQVTYHVETEKFSFDVFFQLAPGDTWQLYTVRPANTIAPGEPLALKVISIANNEIEVSVVEQQADRP